MSSAPSWLGLNSAGQRVVPQSSHAFYSDTKAPNSSYRSSGSGSSARSVATTTSPIFDTSSITNSLNAAMDRIFKINQENTARSEAQAAELRSWQERQNANAMEFNAAEAAKNRDWQQMMSNTAHQREVADLQAAGLNPILSASGGNGAAVTSGATASGVTSSGAKGEVDTSATQALVGLLGTMWSAQTQLESQRLTAQNNMAIAEKNNAVSQAIATLQSQSQQEVARISGQFGLDIAEINGAASALAARIHAGATVSSSQISAAAYQYATSMGYEGTQLRVAADLIMQQAKNENSLQVAEIGYDSSLDSAKTHAQSAKDVATINNWNSLYGFSKNIGNALLNELFGSAPSGIPGLSSGSRGSFGGTRRSRSSGFGKK